MVLRWAAATLRVVEKGFVRIRGFEYIAQLEEALRDSQSILKAACNEFGESLNFN